MPPDAAETPGEDYPLASAQLRIARPARDLARAEGGRTGAEPLSAVPGARLGEAVVHFMYQRARRGGGIPLILGHGWPSAFIEYLALVPLLTDPAAHGIRGPEFDR